MITKFNSSSPPSFVREGEFQTGVPAWWVTINNNDYRLFDGDYILLDDDGVPVKYISSSDYSNVILQNLVHEAIGKETVRDLFKTLKNQNLTQAEEGDILSRIYPVLGCLADGFIRGARVICNSTATGGQFTQARKTYLLGKIDEAISKL